MFIVLRKSEHESNRFSLIQNMLLVQLTDNIHTQAHIVFTKVTTDSVSSHGNYYSQAQWDGPLETNRSVFAG